MVATAVENIEAGAETTYFYNYEPGQYVLYLASIKCHAHDKPCIAVFVISIPEVPTTRMARKIGQQDK